MSTNVRSRFAAARRHDNGELRVVRSLEHEQWSGFVAAHPHGTIFHTPEMHRVFAQTRRHRPGVWATLNDAGDICALLTPVAITTLGGPLRSLTTRIVAFGGPLVASGPDGTRGINTLLDAYQRRGARKSLFTEVRNLVDATDVASALASRGFRHENHLNFLVDLTMPEEEQWRRVAPSARRNIQSARRNGVTVVEAQHPLEVAAGYEVLRDVYARIQVPLPDRSLFDAADAILRPLERFKILLAKLDDHVIGVLTLLLYKDTVLYWYTGTLRAHARSRPGDLLVWHAIELARAGGYRVLDFGGAGKPDEPYGVRDFKAKYGGQLVDHGRDVWVPRDVRLRVATAGYEKLRKFL